MTSRAFRPLLERTRTEESVFGILALDYILRRRFIEVVDEGIRTYNKLRNLSEMADQHRDKLKQTWRTITPCANARDKCSAGACTCSYQEYLQYRSLREAQYEYERRYASIAQDCYELRATWQYVLVPELARLQRDEEYMKVFAEALFICGDISVAERDIAEMPGFLSVRLLPDALELKIGSEAVATKSVPTTHEPLHRR